MFNLRGMDPLRLLSSSPEETVAIGLRLGHLLKGRSLPVVVLLKGDLGSGKTTLIKGIASALGIDSRDVGSASFVIAAEYETQPPFCHIDLYRLASIEEAEDIGLWDYLSREAITVVEWADRIERYTEREIGIYIIDVDDHSREIIIEGLNEEDRYHLQAC